jgi:hypothetical protein
VLRDALRGATVSVLGDQALPALERFEPHVSFAYANRPVDAAPLLERLPAATRSDPVRISPPAVVLAAVTRREHHYQWTVRSEALSRQPAQAMS